MAMLGGAGALPGLVQPPPRVARGQRDLLRGCGACLSPAARPRSACGRLSMRVVGL